MDPRRSNGLDNMSAKELKFKRACAQ
jgi:hypothetical protein